MRYISIPFVFLLFLLVSACQPNPEPANPIQEETRPVTRISGRVVLPAGATISLNNLSVVSSWDNIPVADGNYSLEVNGKFSTLFATDQAGEIFLMGYNYPGQPDFEISPKSTALALLMTSPTMQSLTEEGRLKAIQRLKADANFPKLVSTIDEVIVAGKPITDPTNIRILNLTAEMFRVASLERIAKVVRPKPIVINRASRVVSLRNNLVAHDYVAGLYKDGVKVGKSMIIKGTPMFVSSVYEALKGLFFKGSSEPDQQLVELKGDGKFSFRVRSGAFDTYRPNQVDQSPEFREARDLNGSDYIIKILLEHAPIPAECLSEIRNTIYSIPGNAAIIEDAFKATSLDEFNVAMLTLIVKSLQGSAELVKGCSIIKPGKVATINLFIKGLSKYLKFLSLDSKVAAGCNIAAHTFDLFNSTAAIDTCFQANGKVITNCDCLPQTDPILQVLTGGNTQTWRLIGYNDNFFRRWNVNPPILGIPPTITFRTNYTLTRSIIGFGHRNGPTLAGGPPIGQGYVEFTIVGNSEESYCLNRDGKYVMLSFKNSSFRGSDQILGNVVTFPDPNTLIISSKPGTLNYVHDNSVYTYSKQ